MKCKIKNSLVSLLLLYIFSSSSLIRSVNFMGNSSYIQVTPGATFALNQGLSSVNGKIIKDSTGTISGSTISFDQGIFAVSLNPIIVLLPCIMHSP